LGEVTVRSPRGFFPIFGERTRKSQPQPRRSLWLPTLEEYSERFRDFFHFTRREDGVLLGEAHTNGGPIQLSVQNHRALGQMLKAVGADPENEVLILTGSGDEFMMRSDPAGFALEEEDLEYWAYE
jgi:hypothetical protein